MKNVIKFLSSFMLILNPIGGFLIVAALWSRQLYFLPLIILGVILNLKFYFYTHKEECAVYDAWYKKFSSEHTYLGQDYYCEFWKNNATGEIIEI